MATFYCDPDIDKATCYCQYNVSTHLLLKEWILQNTEGIAKVCITGGKIAKNHKFYLYKSIKLSKTSIISSQHFGFTPKLTIHYDRKIFTL